MSWTRGWSLAFVAVVALLGACDSDGATRTPSNSTTVSSSNVSVTPSVADVGSAITMTPKGIVDRRCLDILQVSAIVNDTHELIGYLGGNPPTWQRVDGATPPTLPGCAPPPSAEPASYVVPDLKPGTYELCLGSTPSSCGLMTIQ